MRRRVLGLAVLAVSASIVVGLAGGCSSDEGSGSETFRIGNTGAAVFDSPNPFVAVSIQSHSVYRYLYPYLVQYDRDLEIVGSFASKWSTSPDGKTWTFTTRPKAKWSDGKPLTAKDAAWTFNTMVKYQAGAAAAYARNLVNISEISAPSDTELVIELTERGSPSAFLSRVQFLPILPEHVFAPHATGKEGVGLKRFSNLPMVSGGPFTLEKYKDRTVALFTRNENWWGRAPHITNWGLQQYTSPDALVQALKANEIDMAQNLPPTSVKSVDQTSGLSVKKETGLLWSDIGFNSNPEKTDKPEIRDPQFRLAFGLALNREKLIDTVLLGAGTPGVSIVPPSTGRWFNKDLKPLPHDPAQANEILDGLGFRKGGDGIREANGHKMSYQLIYLAGNNRLVDLIQTDLKAVGIELVPKLVGDAAYVPAITADDYKKFDLSMDYWNGSPDPDPILSSQTCATLNDFSETAYCSKQYDDLFARQGVAPNDDERQKLVWEMQDLLAKDRPYDVLFYQDAIEGLADGWSGLAFTGAGSVNPYSNDSLLDVKSD